MRLHRPHLFGVLFALLAGIPACGQGNAIRAIFPEFSGVFAEQGMFRRWNYGLGYDHAFKHGMAMGIDAILGGVVLDDESVTDIEYEGDVGSFDVSRRSWSVIYRTSAFTGGDDGGFYLGSYVGVRRATQVYELLYVTSSAFNVSGTGPFEQRTVVDRTVFPVGLRIGVRGPLDGWMSDLYMQVGHQIGAGAPRTTRSYLRGDLRDIRGLVITVGFAYGVGW